MTAVSPRWFGAYPGASPSDNVSGLNAAFAFAMAEGMPVVELEPGSYWVNAPVGVDVATDTSARLHIRGAGRRATWIYAQDNVVIDPLLRFRAQSGNLRDVVVDDVSIWGGVIGCELSHVAYSLFRNVTFRAQTLYSLVARDNTNRMSIVNPWFVHLKANAVMVSSGNLDLYAPVFGEDAGGIYVTGGVLRVNGGRMAQSGWRGTEDPGGLVSNFGGKRATINVGTSGSVDLCGVDVVAGGSGENMVDVLHANNPESVRMTGCRLVADAEAGAVMAFRSAFNAEVQMTGCRTYGAQLARLVSGPMPAIQTGNVHS